MLFYPISEDELTGLEGERWHDLIARIRGRGPVREEKTLAFITPDKFPDDLDGA